MTNESSFEKIESSSNKINYLIRPAKQIERKLIIDALHCLRKIYPISEYQYIGMGSLFYVDCQLFHKYLGIKDMTSMEMDEDRIDRYKFNKPYDFINLITGFSTDILPTINWDKNTFIWLDYDSKISLSVLADIQIICNSIKQGGILIITVDAEPKRFKSDNDKTGTQEKQLLENFKKNLHPYHPHDIAPRDLSLKKYPELLQKIISKLIQENVSRREINTFQIFNFVYKDTSQMYTFGCIFEKSHDCLEQSGIFNQTFVSVDEKLIEINVPIITPLEKIHFDKLIPGISEKLTAFEISKGLLDNYEKYYKYYPQYFESLL